MPDQMPHIEEAEFIPPVRVAEFPPGQLALQSPEGWIYQRIDGKDVYPNANQQPISNYYDVHRPEPDNPERRYILWPDGKVIAVSEIPVWDWDGTSLAAKHFRPVPTSVPPSYLPEPTPPPDYHPLPPEDGLQLVLHETNHNLRRIASALEGILADLTKGNDADKGD